MSDHRINAVVAKVPSTPRVMSAPRPRETPSSKCSPPSNRMTIRASVTTFDDVQVDGGSHRLDGVGGYGDRDQEDRGGRDPDPGSTWRPVTPQCNETPDEDDAAEQVTSSSVHLTGVGGPERASRKTMRPVFPAHQAAAY